jgi:transposase
VCFGIQELIFFRAAPCRAARRDDAGVDADQGFGAGSGTDRCGGAGGVSRGELADTGADRLAEVFADEPFAAAFEVRGAPGLAPGMSALVTVLQHAEDLTDRQAAAMAARAIDWKYALGMELTDSGFDHSVLSKSRTRLVKHGMERVVFDRLLEHCRRAGLVDAGGKQRTDSTHVISAARELNRLELAGESIRAALEAIVLQKGFTGAELGLRCAVSWLCGTR